MENIIGRRFGNLLVVSLDQEKSFKYKYFNTICDCGNTKSIRMYSLLSGATKSCGCIHKQQLSERSFIDLTGKKFGRLTATSVNRSNNGIIFWNCVCDCGELSTVTRGSLTSGNTKSCGCLAKEVARDLHLVFPFTEKGQEQKVAKHLYSKEYSDGLTFKQFFYLSQLPCFYCGDEKSNKMITKYNTNEDCFFQYNGIDKVNNSLGHIFNNCITACKSCNSLKHLDPIDKFISRLNAIINNENIHINDYSSNINNVNIKQFLLHNNFVRLTKSGSIKKTDNGRCLYDRYRGYYNDSDLTFEQFVWLSQIRCHYCLEEANNINKLDYSKTIQCKYNGIDRFNNNYGHELKNCVPSCIACNAGKNNKSVNEFISHIEKCVKHLCKLKIIKNNKFNSVKFAEMVSIVHNNFNG